MKIIKFLSAALLLLTSFFVSAVTVVNSGRSGWNSRQLREIYDAELTKNKPDLVILLVGTNDHLNSHNIVPATEFRANLEAMVKATQATGAKLLLCEIPNANEALMRNRHKPGFFDAESAASRIKRANATIAEVAKQYNVPLFLTTEALGESTDDAASLFRNAANSGNEDGVHPTPRGYFRFADLIARRLRAEGWKPERILCIGDSITYGVGVKGAGTAAIDAESYPGRLLKELSRKPL